MKVRLYIQSQEEKKISYAW